LGRVKGLRPHAVPFERGRGQVREGARGKNAGSIASPKGQTCYRKPKGQAQGTDLLSR
jgi:hypothetical protein